MTTYNGLPLWEAKIDMSDYDTGMFCVSLVDAPATESNFLAFNKEEKLITYSVQDEEQRKVFGLVMAADMPIYRIGNGGYEYYIVYSRETLADMMEKYFAQGFQNNVDTMHNFEMEDGITLTQMFVKDTEKGVSPKGFEDYADGSIFAEYKIHNDEVWNSIKNGEYKGFSLAGYFNVEETFNKENKTDNIFMSKLKKIKQVLRTLLVEMNEISTDAGIITWDGEEDIKIGDEVKGMDEEGNSIDIADGEYTTEDKKVIVVSEGKVSEIREPEEETQEEESQENEQSEETQEEENAEATAEEDTTEDKTTEDEKDSRIKELEDEIAAKNAEIEELKAKIAELEKEPAAQPAAEEFEKADAKDDNTQKGKMEKRGYRFTK